MLLLCGAATVKYLIARPLSAIEVLAKAAHPPPLTAAAAAAPGPYLQGQRWLPELVRLLRIPRVMPHRPGHMSLQHGGTCKGISVGRSQQQQQQQQQQSVGLLVATG